jgi:hypothetical protein
MLEYVFNLGGYILKHTGKFSSNEWIIISVVVLILGFFLTRGFESKGRL